MGRANVRAFHEKPYRIQTELTFINPKSALSQNKCFFGRPLKYLKLHRQTVWIQIRLLLQEQSDLGLHCLPLCLCYIDIFRCSYFAGVLRTK